MTTGFEVLTQPAMAGIGPPPNNRAPTRVVIENVQPCINGGRFPIKRVPGEEVLVTADIHADGSDSLRAVLRYRPAHETRWMESPMSLSLNDTWTGRWTPEAIGRYDYTIEAWVDRYAGWRTAISKKLEAGTATPNDYLEGAEIMDLAAKTNPAETARLDQCASLLRSEETRGPGLELAFAEEMGERLALSLPREHAATLERPLAVNVEPLEARYSAWYEMFPRSAGQDPDRSATLREAESRLPGIAAMGFSVVYLPPIHPIGQSYRKGPNNRPRAGPADPGSPWAIGSAEGGHKAVDPALGTLQDFDHFVEAAAAQGLRVALDLAYQCSPDHPYLREHPEWFRHRPDGSIQHAENPPKVYEDIVPFDFDSRDWRGLWDELKSIVTFWIEHGVHLFRADNPHTKPYLFWEWLIAETQTEHPGVIFLAEAFTRPKMMHYLAKCGFSQSYTFFTWRNTKKELTEYLTELSRPPVSDYLRPNLFTNTPDILHAYLQTGGRAAHEIRLILAATLGASYGIYGPAFELAENAALPDSEDYKDSEKYQIRTWDWNRPGNIKNLITQVNKIRQDNPALHANAALHFYPTNNDSLLCYSKTTPDLANIILVVINLDPHLPQDGWVHFSGTDLGLEPGSVIEVHDLLSDARYRWGTPANYVRLDPAVIPAHIFRVRRKIKTEADFDYFQ